MSCRWRRIFSWAEQCSRILDRVAPQERVHSATINLDTLEALTFADEAAQGLTEFSQFMSQS